MAMKFWLMTSSFVLMMDFCGHASGQTKRQIWEVDLAKIPGIGAGARDELPVLALELAAGVHLLAAVYSSDGTFAASTATLTQLAEGADPRPVARDVSATTASVSASPSIITGATKTRK